MVFGVIAMILVGISWIVWGYVAGEAPRRNLSMGLMIALCSAMAIIICLLIVGALLIMEKSGISLPQAVCPVLPAAGMGSLMVLFMVIIGGFFNFTQLQFMSKAMANGPNGIIWSIVQAGFIVPFALGIICFGEKMTWAFACAIVLVVAALVLFAVTADNRSKGHWLMFALFSFISTCICQSMQYIPSNFPAAAGVSGLWRTMGYFAGMFLGFVFHFICSSSVRSELAVQIRNKYTWRYSLLIDTVEIITCSCLLYPGLDALADSKIGAISTQLMTASGIVSFEAYAVLVLKEKRSFLQVTALVLCLLSIAAICF